MVRKQADAGIDIVNDGEYGKSSWANYALIAHERLRASPRPDAAGGTGSAATASASPTSWRRNFRAAPSARRPTPASARSDTSAQQSIRARHRRPSARRSTSVKVEEAFYTAVAPASAGYDGINEYYQNEREYVFAIAEALREEYCAIVEAGFVLQVDDAVLANMYDQLVAAEPASVTANGRELRVDALNHALEGIPEDRVRYHVCFGSWHVPHVADAPLEDDRRPDPAGAAPAPIRSRRPTRATSTNGGCGRRCKLPPGKILIPGVVTHHTTTVEHPRLVADRIVRFAKLVGRENVIAGTDCGFAQSEGIAARAPAGDVGEVRSLAEGARLASKELWGK